MILLHCIILAPLRATDEVSSVNEMDATEIT